MLIAPTVGGMPSVEDKVANTGKISARPCKSFKSLYKVTDKVLGEGLNGEVKLAVHRETGKKVALKMYRRAQMNSQETTDLMREVTTQSSLRHPNVAKVEAIFQSENNIRLLVEHLSGGSVFEDAFKGIFSEERAISVIRQLLSAVEHIHSEGMVHRDIKPENIIYSSKDKKTAKLIDFGFCTYWKQGDKPMWRRCGTESYMAPEVIRQLGYTSQADMWSVGVVAHVLLTREMPGRHSDFTPILSERLGKCSLEAQKFVAALLNIDPAIRMTAEKALAHTWMQSEATAVRSRFDSTVSTSASSIDSEPLFKFRSFCAPRKSVEDKDDFSPVCPAAKPSDIRREKKSIWQALGAGKVGAMLAAARNFRSTRASRVSAEVVDM